jgi:hypothetical protein
MLKIKGYQTVAASKPGKVATGDPVLVRRSKFGKSIRQQLELLEKGWQRKGELRERDPRWYWKQGDHFFTGVRYGAKSLIGEGQAYRFNGERELREFYEMLLEQTNGGAFDKDLGEASDRMKAATAGALEAARAARGRKGARAA